MRLNRRGFLATLLTAACTPKKPYDLKQSLSQITPEIAQQIKENNGDLNLAIRLHKYITPWVYGVPTFLEQVATVPDRDEIDGQANTSCGCVTIDHSKASDLTGSLDILGHELGHVIDRRINRRPNSEFTASAQSYLALWELKAHVPLQFKQKDPYPTIPIVSLIKTLPLHQFQELDSFTEKIKIHDVTTISYTGREDKKSYDKAFCLFVKTAASHGFSVLPILKHLYEIQEKKETLENKVFSGEEDIFKHLQKFYQQFEERAKQVYKEKVKINQGENTLWGATTPLFYGKSKVDFYLGRFVLWQMQEKYAFLAEGKEQKKTLLTLESSDTHPKYLRAADIDSYFLQSKEELDQLSP